MSPKRWSLLVASLLGLAAMVLPVVVFGAPRYSAPLFPLIRTSVERVGLPAAGLLFVAGLGLGRFGSGPPWLLGLATMALFPLSAIAEMFADGTSHNLWPIEFVMYAFLSLPASLGALIGRVAKNKASGK